MFEDLLDLLFRGGLSGIARTTDGSRLQAFALFLFMSAFCVVCGFTYAGISCIVFTTLAILTGIAALVTLMIGFRS